MNNRRKGHNYERQIANELKNWFPGSLTTRFGAGNKKDYEGIDIINTGMFNVQCKRKQNLNPFTVLQNMPKDHRYNLIFWKKDRVRDTVVLDKEDFYEILEMLKSARIL
jgi:hypothetical protein